MFDGSQRARPTGLLLRLAALAVASLPVIATDRSLADDPPSADSTPGQRFLVEEPITSESLGLIKAACKTLISRAAADRKRPVLVFEFRAGKSRPGESEFGSSYDLASVITNELAGAKTVAYVPEPLGGYAVLPALACDEIVMGSNSTLGPITPEGQAVNAGFRELVKNLAVAKGREPGLYLGMLDRDADLQVVRTADKQIHYLLPEELPDFEKAHQVVGRTPAWDGARRGVMLARRARDEGFIKLISDDVLEVFNAYRITGSLAIDPSLLAEPKAVWIKVEGQINTVKERYIAQRLQKARTEGVNLVFLEINSEGGMDLAAGNIAQFIADQKEIKTVAYVDDRALGVAALIPLACDDIVMHKGSRIGNVTQIMTGPRDGVKLTEKQVVTLAIQAKNLCQAKNHPTAIALAMIEPDAAVVSAKDKQTGASGYFSQGQVDAEPGRFLDVVRVKEPGAVLTIDADQAVSFGLGRRAADEEDLKSLYRLKGKSIRVDGPTWVDGLVQTLNDPFISFLLLFVGFFMLILEIKMPGVGLPAITSVLAFLLFFWSRFLSGTADQLEILLFVVGLICLGMELFVFPGLGVFGVSGVLLILVSIVMASQTFVWPTQEYEYRQMLSSVLQVTGVLVSVGAGVAVVGRFLPSIPLFNRLILKPETWDADDPGGVSGKGGGDVEASLSFLLGETGRTTTVLRPMGKARFGEMLVDVTADGFYLGTDTLIEVVEVHGQRVVVRPVR